MHLHRHSPAKYVFQSVEEFRGLSSSSQNAQLFKILSAIHDEIGKLKASTDARFTYLENIVHQQHRQQRGAQQPPPRPSVISSPRFPAASSGHWSEASGGGGGQGHTYRVYNSRNAAG